MRMSADAPLVALSAVGRTQNERRDDAVRRRDELSHYVIKLFRLTRLDASAPPAQPSPRNTHPLNHDACARHARAAGAQVSAFR